MACVGGTASAARLKRPKSSAQRGDDTELQHAWKRLGRPSGYDAPGEQELKDLASNHNQKRGERQKKRRLKANWQLLERAEGEAELAAQPSTGPAVPPYLLERGERTCSAQRDAPSYVDVAALRARWVPMPEIADADEVGDGWMRESLADAARREREYVACMGSCTRR